MDEMKIAALRLAGHKWETIANYSGKPASSLRRWWATGAKEKYSTPIFEWFGYTPEISTTVVAGSKVAVIADIHAHPDRSLTEKLINLQPNHIIIAGDILDSAAINPHEKRNAISLEGEIRIMRAWLEGVLRRTNASVTVMRGNHDDWAARTLNTIVPDALRFLVGDPLALLVGGFEDRVVLHKGQAVVNGIPVENADYFMVIGDALISHIDFTGSQSGDASRKLYKWYNDWRRTLNIDCNVFIQAHVHHMSYNAVDGGNAVLIEPGMFASPLAEGYKLGQKGKWRPGTQGFVTFELVKNSVVKISMER